MRPRMAEPKLDAAAEDVYYELEQMILAISRKPTDAHLQNMLVEAFLVHYRNLRDFLFPTLDTLNMPAGREQKNPKAQKAALDTVIANDFAPQWQHHSAEYVGLDKDERDRINRRIMHISYSRQHLDNAWNWLAMARLLCDQFTAFLEVVPPEGRSRFEPAKQILGRIQWG